MEPIGRDVARELGRFGPQGAMPEILAAWPDAVGEAIARHAWPARVARDGGLHVHTADSTWAFELAQRAHEIARRLGVPSVRFAPGPLPEPSAEGGKASASRRPEPGAQELAAAAELASAVDDPDLRELVRRAAAASLARPRHDRGV